MHLDAKSSNSAEYYARPYHDLRPDFVLHVQRSLFLVLCEFFDNQIKFSNSSSYMGEKSEEEHAARATSPSGQNASASIRPSMQLPKKSSRHINRSSVNLHLPEIFLAQRRLLALFVDSLKQTVEHCLIDDINPIRFALAAQGAMLALSDKERIDHGCEAHGNTEHIRQSVVKLYRAHLHQLVQSFELLADHFGTLATNLLDFLPSSGREAGRIMHSVLEVGNPSSIALAEGNTNLNFLAHELVQQYIGIGWNGMLWEKCFVDPGDWNHSRPYNGFFNPFMVPGMRTPAQPQENNTRVASSSSWNAINTSSMCYDGESLDHEGSLWPCANLAKSARSFHTRLRQTAKELFAPARYLKSPAARYFIEVCSYIATTLLHFGVLLGDVQHCDDEDYSFTRYDLALAVLTLGHAMNDMETVSAFYSYNEQNSVSGSPVVGGALVPTHLTTVCMHVLLATLWLTVSLTTVWHRLPPLHCHHFIANTHRPTACHHECTASDCPLPFKHLERSRPRCCWNLALLLYLQRYPGIGREYVLGDGHCATGFALNKLYPPQVLGVCG